MVAAFGSNDDRKLDTTVSSIVANPGPGTYQTSNNSPSTASIEKIQTAVFKSASVRKENLAGDPTVPGPDSYNLADHKSISRKPLQGGAPNNVLSLQKAENKKMIDQMFPFLVKGRMETDARL